ncbi:hypothetical protein [Myxococcus xanthus]|uniref:hypothetical protein n=1 Tax=Myxococcus xanthus TaxID=34 RepID=UPI00112CDFEA|nr:hypothetical protein [Myxococcus xanthus]
MKGTSLLLCLALGTSTTLASPPLQSPQAPRSTQARPVLVLQTSATEIRQGTPFVLNVYLRYEAHPPLSRSDKGPSIDTVHLDDIRLNLDIYRNGASKDRAPLSWPFKATERHSKNITLRPSEAPTLIARYVLTAEQTSKIPPATYIIQAWFDTRKEVANSNWLGSESSGALIQISPEGSAPSPADICEKTLGTRAYWLALGDSHMAFVVLNDFLTQTPKPTAAKCWAALAEVHEKAGNLPAARDAYCDAGRAVADELIADVAREAPNPGRSSVHLPPYMRRCNELTMRLAPSDSGEKAP